MPELERILCIEDEPDIGAIVKLTLEQLGGYTVTLCSSGELALQTLGEAQPQLILLDVMMPGMDGPTTLEKIREQPDFGATPVAFMTAKVQPDEVSHFLSLGAVDVIAKPFDPMTLPDKVQSLWLEADR